MRVLGFGLSLAALLLAACGSSTGPSSSSSSNTTTAAGGAGGNAGGAGGAACSQGNPSGACAGKAQCVTPDIACRCEEGNLACSSTSTGDPVSLDLPAAAPTDGACCANEGVICGGYADCGPICSCVAGHWSCATPNACPPFTCPDTMSGLFALGEQACPSLIGTVCSAHEGCSTTACECKLDPENGSATWRCTTTPC